MSAALVANRIRRGFYLDSVALMRLSQERAALPGVDAGSLMTGTDANKAVLAEAGLLAAEGESAGANDVILAVRGADRAALDAALNHATAALDRPAAGADGARTWNPKSLDGALDALPAANLAVISAPGAFAAREARRALARGLHVMLFSDNVTVEDECALKAEAEARGLLLMGPDCGTAILGGAPLGFANAVPRGEVGIVSASGTGLQEVASLIARGGGGVSHGIGVGGRDLGDAVGGATTLRAIDALERDPATRRIVVISKPPGETVAARVRERAARATKPFTICFLGARPAEIAGDARHDVATVATLRDAARRALGREATTFDPAAAARDADPGRPGADRVYGLFAGGSLCAEAQVVLRDAAGPIFSNAPIDGVARLANEPETGHVLIDLGADEYTVGRPHPMIDPSLRDQALGRALADPTVAAVLLDVVIGHGAHDDPAAQVARAVAAHALRPAVIASVCGTDDDPQSYTGQRRILEEAGVTVAPSNADAAAVALAVAQAGARRETRR